MNQYLSVLKKYATFRGRARRKEYWMFYLINIIIILALCLIALIAGGIISTLFITLYYLYGLAVIIPSLAVLVRRLHDTGKSGAWFFIGFIPLIGIIWLLVLLCKDGTHGENSYGPDPKAV